MRHDQRNFYAKSYARVRFEFTIIFAWIIVICVHTKLVRHVSCIWQASTKYGRVQNRKKKEEFEVT
jgi:hypothetical protein